MATTATKIKDAAIKTGEYTDQQTGEIKARWSNVGAVMKDEKGDTYLVMDRTFNPAGVPNPDNRSNVIIGLFDPRVRGDI